MSDGPCTIKLPLPYETPKVILCKLYNNYHRDFMSKCEIFPFVETIYIIEERSGFIHWLPLEGSRFQCGIYELIGRYIYAQMSLMEL